MYLVARLFLLALLVSAEAGAAASQGDVRPAMAAAGGDAAPAELRYARAAQAGSDDAASELALLYIEQGTPARALPWLEAAARRGDARATGLLATLYVNGGGIAPDLTLAYALSTRAAASGLPAAKAQLQFLTTRLSPATIADAPERLRQWEALGQGTGPVAAAAPAAPGSAATIAFPPMPQWQAQLGQFGSIGKARIGWGVLTRQLKLGSDVTPIVLDNGYSIRLRLAAASEADARTLCRRILDAKTPCLPVRRDRDAATMHPVPL